MRFFPSGPALPDDLLIARDEGRVVFFCGAGVSRARAGLESFFGLAEAVLRDLGVTPDDPASVLFKQAKESEAKFGASLVSADRIFGLLERSFPTADIERVVANSLRPLDNVDLSAHRLLLDLATTTDGKVRLVTTNFDRLFEACGTGVAVAQPPRLPDPRRDGEMNCIVHLHGCVTENYDGAGSDGFVLSSAEFGRAYLSEGWATQFFREILDRYVVVFVGYTADDPPVQYLLEALNRTGGTPRSVYAFQFGKSSDVSGKWHDRGVEAITYSEADNHRELWDTLEAWACRARDPVKWKRSIVERAGAGPSPLKPHERGQVAHLVSTLEGARLFAEYEPAPPAEWLCVFDRYRRYAPRRRPFRLEGEAPEIDPFDLYGLDSDVAPNRIPVKSDAKEPDPVHTAWDAFESNRVDALNLRPGSLASLRGYRAADASLLSPRVDQLGRWIARVADQPAAVWWAGHQQGLHPDTQRQIRYGLDQSPQTGGSSSLIRRGWWYLFEAWEEKPEDLHRDWYDLKPSVDKDGWTGASVRRYAALFRPYIKAGPNLFNGGAPPQVSDDLTVGDLFQLEIGYPDPIDDVLVTDEFLPLLLREQRKNLERAMVLEEEVGGYGMESIESIDLQQSGTETRYSRTHGLNGQVLAFARVFEQLEKIDIAAARREFRAWSEQGSRVFGPLRIWAARKPEVASPEIFGQVISTLDDNVFWSPNAQRDLLLALSERWRDLDLRTRVELEDRLLLGRNKYANEDDDEFLVNRAWQTLNCIHWLANAGCHFQFDLDAETERLNAIAPKWERRYSASTFESSRSRGGWVRTDTDHSALMGVPIESILEKAQDLSGRTDDFLVERDPFAGLCSEYPVRALRALTKHAKLDSYPEWAWRAFLRDEARKNDSPRFTELIAARLAGYPEDAIGPFIRSVCDWLKSKGKVLAERNLPCFDYLFSKLVQVLHSPSYGSSSIKTEDNRDWVMEAINSPAGTLADAIMVDPRQKGRKSGEGFSPAWLQQVQSLLELADDKRRHALILFAFNLNWFFAIDPTWTEANLISVLDGGRSEDRDAVWAGFLWGSTTPAEQLYVRLKDHLLCAVDEGPVSRRGYGEALAGLILVGWGAPLTDGKTCISDNEMRGALLRGDDDFRMHTLWQIKNWAKEDRGVTWRQKLPTFLSDVWPRQKAVKTPKISALLADLAFSVPPEMFPKVAEAILPLLTIADQKHLMLPELRKGDIVDQYPREAASILHAILPEQVSAWPYGIGEVLNRLIAQTGHPIRDDSLLELKRRWDSR